MKKIVIFNGSPRKDGNTVTVLDQIAQGARQMGADVKFYTLFKMKFLACAGCFYCRLHEDCYLNDDLKQALQKVKDADAVVIGSPIFMMQMSGMVKNLYDRLFPLTDAEYKPRFGTKKMATVYTQGMDDPRMFESYFQYTAAMLPSLGFDLVDNIVVTNANNPERADQDKELKIRAYELGASLAG